jgi:hypothetical protein
MDAVRKLVTARLNSKATGPHPEPELLAAFAENSLPAPDRNQLLAHFANCADCRDVLFLALPESASLPAVSPVSYKRPRFAFRWATLAACVAVLATVAVTNRQIFTHQDSNEVHVTSPQPVAPKEPKPEQSSPEIYAKVQPPAKHMTAKPQASLQFDESGQVHFAARPASAGAASRVAANTVSSQPSWRVSDAGAIQRSVNSGATWEQVPIADDVVFRAISSRGAEIWAGGVSGTLFHSRDSGRTWAKVEPASAGRKLQSDITRIVFSDANSGQVFTSAGEIWATSDGGRSWVLK